MVNCLFLFFLHTDIFPKMRIKVICVFFITHAFFTLAYCYLAYFSQNMRIKVVICVFFITNFFTQRWAFNLSVIMMVCILYIFYSGERQELLYLGVFTGQKLWRKHGCHQGRLHHTDIIAKKVMNHFKLWDLNLIPKACAITPKANITPSLDFFIFVLLTFITINMEGWTHRTEPKDILRNLLPLASLGFYVT